MRICVVDEAQYSLQITLIHPHHSPPLAYGILVIVLGVWIVLAFGPQTERRVTLIIILSR